MGSYWGILYTNRRRCPLQNTTKEENEVHGDVETALSRLRLVETFCDDVHEQMRSHGDAKLYILCEMS